MPASALTSGELPRKWAFRYTTHLAPRVLVEPRDRSQNQEPISELLSRRSSSPVASGKHIAAFHLSLFDAPFRVERDEHLAKTGVKQVLGRRHVAAQVPSAPCARRNSASATKGRAKLGGHVVPTLCTWYASSTCAYSAGVCHTLTYSQFAANELCYEAIEGLALAATHLSHPSFSAYSQRINRLTTQLQMDANWALKTSRGYD